MATLYRYFKDLWKLAVVALVLAAINQIFSLLDPLIFRHIIDSYATRYRRLPRPSLSLSDAQHRTRGITSYGIAEIPQAAQRAGLRASSDHEHIRPQSARLLG